MVMVVPKHNNLPTSVSLFQPQPQQQRSTATTTTTNNTTNNSSITQLNQLLFRSATTNTASNCTTRVVAATSSSSISTTVGAVASTTKLTKAAMARRFLLRSGRKKSTTDVTSPTTVSSTNNNYQHPRSTILKIVPPPPPPPPPQQQQQSPSSVRVNVEDESFVLPLPPYKDSRNNVIMTTTTTAIHSSSNPTISKVTTVRTPATSSSSSNAVIVETSNGTTGSSSNCCCLLCYDDMDQMDSQIHPIVCCDSSGGGGGVCTFNCCTTCAQTICLPEPHLPNDVVVTTENGNNAVVVDAPTNTMTTTTTTMSMGVTNKKIKCPNCRSDVSRTIYDTALLRLFHRHFGNSSSRNHNHNTIDALLLYEVEMAQKREVQFLQEQQQQQQRSKLNFIDPLQQYGEYSLPPPPLSSYNCNNDDDSWYHSYDRSKLIDVTLLCGLENMMSWTEQEMVTRYCTTAATAATTTSAAESKNPLGMAAQLLYHKRIQLQQQQQQQHHHPTGVGGGKDDRCAESNDAMVTIMYQLIEAGKRARYRSNPLVQPQQMTTAYNNAESPSPTTTHRKRPEYYTKRSTQKATQFRKIENEVRRQTAYIKRYPLPNRLPKYCEFQITIDCSNDPDSNNDNVSVSQIVKRLPFRFCNDQWDGSIMDAYTKFIIQRCTTTYDPKKLLRGKNYSGINTSRQNITSIFVDNYKVHQRRPYDDMNIRNILNIEQQNPYHHDSTLSENPTDDDTRDVCACTTDVTRHLDDDRIVDDVDVVVIERSQQRQQQTTTTTNDSSRVMIASIVNMDVASMIFPGDVVTHINGIELHDYTVDDIIALICSLCDSEATTTTIPTELCKNATTTDEVPPPPPSSPIQQTLSMLDETINLFSSSTLSMSMDTDRSVSPKSLLHNRKTTTQQKVLKLQFVFNADVAVAKALQLRATAIRWQQ